MRNQTNKKSLLAVNVKKEAVIRIYGFPPWGTGSLESKNRCPTFSHFKFPISLLPTDKVMVAFFKKSSQEIAYDKELLNIAYLNRKKSELD